jgi:hypothetical protein
MPEPPSGLTDAEPVRRALWCPHCGVRHIDLDEWAIRPHHVHLCLTCSHSWDEGALTYGDLLPGEGTAMTGLTDADARLDLAIERMSRDSVRPRFDDAAVVLGALTELLPLRPLADAIAALATALAAEEAETPP